MQLPAIGTAGRICEENVDDVPTTRGSHMSAIIRRVAEAIAVQSGDDPNNWMAYSKAARAALSAMQEPDERMLAAVSHMQEAGTVYRRMIAAALSGE